MRRRLLPPIAAFLAVCFPGLGHLLLRRYWRAVVWNATIVGGAFALTALYDVGAIDPFGTIADLAAAVPASVALPLGLLIALSALDAFLIGRRETAETTGANTSAIDRGESGDGLGPVSVEAIVDGRAGEDAPDAEGSPVVECPNCGRETDADLDFCHWCTESLGTADAE